VRAVKAVQKHPVEHGEFFLQLFRKPAHYVLCKAVYANKIMYGLLAYLAYKDFIYHMVTLPA
jgi:hypothetical protein